MGLIKDLVAREILDSRGNPTIEVECITDDGFKGVASVPSGASTGSKEALELRDGDERFDGKGVLKAVNNVSLIKEKLLNVDVSDINKIDNIMLELDGTLNKSKLGANAILGVSLAVYKAAAKDLPFYKYIGEGNVLPVAMMNILNGGVHADNKLSFQEFMIVPKRDNFKERIRVGAEVFYSLKNMLKENGHSTNVGDEGGFAPNLNSNVEALDFLVSAIKEAGYVPGRDVFIALDAAASEFYKDGKYLVDEKEITSEELTEYYVDLVNKYPIISIEDSHYEDDWKGFKDITEKLGNVIQLVGDDLFVTNKELLKKGIEEKACNAILIKANQIGSVSEMLETIKLAKENKYRTIISHRSGETDDTFIADFAIGLNLGQIKTGSLSRMERVIKYNRLMKIEDELTKGE